MVHRRRFLKICSLKFCNIWQNFYFYRILNKENFKTEIEQAREKDILEVNNLCETGNDFLFVSMETFKSFLKLNFHFHNLRRPRTAFRYNTIQYPLFNVVNVLS